MSGLIEDEAERRVPGCALAAPALAGAGVLIAMGITVLMEFGSLYPFVLLVTLFVVAVFGGSAFAAIRERATWQNIAATGFLTGAIVPAILGLPALTEPADYFTLVGGFGVAGVAGALTTWLLIKWLQTGGLGAKVGVGLLIGAGVAAMWGVPWALMDRSCHNPMRDGRDSIGAVAGFNLNVTMAEWPEAQAELQRFAHDNGWQMRPDVRPDPGFPWFQVSLCREPGTNIFVSKAAFEENQISITVYQPQGGNSWQVPLRALQDRLENRWPGQTGYDTYSSRPPWAPPAPQPSGSPLRAHEKSL